MGEYCKYGGLKILRRVVTDPVAFEMSFVTFKRDK